MRRRAALVLTVLAVAGGTAACGSDPDAGAAAGAASSTSASAVPADATSRGIAEVEFARQCTVGSASFAGEADLTTDLDARLAAAGFTHEQWKRWHDALADSPELVAEFAHISAAGCPQG